MAKAKVTYGASVAVKLDRPWDMTGLIDMLRYEQARVRGWDALPNGFVRIHMLADTPFTPERWASFGITLTDIETFY